MITPSDLLKIKSFDQLNPSTHATAGSWHEVTTFSGASTKNTETFQTRGSKFRLTYTVRPDNEYSLFNLYVYPDGEDRVFKDQASLASGTDSTVVYAEAGSYYIKVVSANLDGWSIKVEDYY